MGWTFFQDRADLTAAQILTREINGENKETGATWRVIDQSTRGNEWYALVKLEKPGQAPVHYGLVCLFKRSRKTGEFGYKEISEDCGPNASRAPLRIIDQLDQLAPAPNEWARAWRQRCRDNAKRPPRREFKPGQLVQFGQSRVFELIAPAGPRRGWYVQITQGTTRSTYRATAAQLSRAQLVGGVA